MATAKKMTQRAVLISGLTIAQDEKLARQIANFATVVRNTENQQIAAILASGNIDLILLELKHGASDEFELIKQIKDKYPEIQIVLIDGDGDREVIARAFACGVKDAFRKPYKANLLVERVSGILRR